MKFILLLLLIPPGYAHDGHHLGKWNFDPLLLISLTLISVFYLRGFQAHRTKGGEKIRMRHLISFGGSILFLLLALFSPVDYWSDELQSWHMIQHLIIMMIAAPLFTMSSPLYVFFCSLPLRARKRTGFLFSWAFGRKAGYFLWQPLLLWLVFAFTLWIWHLPFLYQAALHHQRLHDLQHISFFVSSVLFWRILIDPISRLRPKKFLSVLYIFATTLHASLLGVFMTFSRGTWYKFYEDRTLLWNLTPLEDQQMAGLIMWMPGCMIYIVATALLFYQGMKNSDS